MKKIFFVLFVIILLPFEGCSSQNNVQKTQDFYQQGMTAGKARQMSQAVDLFQKAIQADPNHFMAWFDLGGAQEAQGNKEKALESYLNTIQIKPEFVEAQLQAGTIYLLHKKDATTAQLHFKTALLQKNPYVDQRFPLKRTQGHLLLNLAVSYAEKGQLGLSNAISEAYLNNLEVEQKFWANMKKLSLKTSAEIQSATKRNFETELSLIGKELHSAENDPVVLNSALNKYLAFEKTHPRTQLTNLDLWYLYEGLAIAELLAGHPQESIPYFEKALAESPKLPYFKGLESIYNLACAFSLTGKIDEALTQIENILWMDFITPKHPHYNASIANPTGAFPEMYSEKLLKDSDLKNVREDPRFNELLKKYGR